MKTNFRKISCFCSTPFAIGIATALNARADVRINAHDLLTGKWMGSFVTQDGEDFEIPGLRALSFEREERLDHESNYNAQRLYFTAVLDAEGDGLVGMIRPASPNYPRAR